MNKESRIYLTGYKGMVGSNLIKLMFMEHIKNECK